MTVKDKIMTTLKAIEPHSYYADTVYTKFPRIMVYLVSNVAWRYSNERHQNRLKYQVSYYIDRPLNVETDPVLWQIIDELEQKQLSTTNWMETVDVDKDANRSIYHYFMEASGV